MSYYGGIKKQNSFTRTLANEEKLGAYYTDVNQCRRMRYLFEFPDNEVCVLEPSIGDASAVLAVTGKEVSGVDSNIKIFGVELNPATYKIVKENPLVDHTLEADFLNGVKISHSFTFCFANPPYGTEQDSGKRYEYLFTDKIWNYLTSRGILALVIPYYTLTDESFLKPFFARYQAFATFRFDDDVYSQFKQVVVIASKRNSIGYLKSTYDGYYNTIDSIEKLPYLPDAPVEHPIKIAPSNDANVEYFTTLEFNREEAGKNLNRSPLYSVFSERIFIPNFSNIDLGQPPMPLKKDLLYLTAISGGGQGKVGNEEDGDLHLQRGVAKVVKTTEYQTDDNGKNPKIIEKSFTRISLNIIQANGTITMIE